MKKQLLFLTLLTGSSLMYAAASAPTQEQLEQDEEKLIRAASTGDIQELKQLIRAPHININATDMTGLTALMNAALYGRKEIVGMLLKDPKINVNAASAQGHDTALMLAAGRGYKEIVEMLLHAGADKTIENKNGRTAEKIAQLNRHPGLANYIRDYQPGQLTKSAKKQ
jgi:uncharacterized protein